MKKQEFIEKLKKELNNVPSNDLKKILDYYEEMIDEAMEDGKSEEEAVALLGDIDDIIAQIPSEQKEYKRVIDSEETILDCDFSKIDVSETFFDVYIVPTDRECKIVCSKAENITREIYVKDGTMYIKSNGRPTRPSVRAWIKLGFFNMNYSSERVTLYLPKNKIYENINIHTSSGNVNLSDGIKFGGFCVNTTSGDITLNELSGTQLCCNSTSGDIALSNTSVSNMAVSSTSGDIKTNDICTSQIVVSATSGDVNAGVINASVIKIDTSSGDVNISEINASSLEVKASSGDVDIHKVEVSEQVKIGTFSGDVYGTLLDGGNISINTSSGDVKLGLCSTKCFDVRSGSGSVRVPDSTLGSGECHVRTGSGDINLRLV